MHISPINPAAAYSGPSEPIALQKKVEPSATESSIFRTWNRCAGKILGATSPADLLSSPQSSEAFWGQWSGKKWRVG
ncbi:MAG: hypothetical protein FJ390_01975 [Verrucomicrobia bacterium]|nr:hypothetical protein [Verrucomicrobiota bacterium]